MPFFNMYYIKLRGLQWLTHGALMTKAGILNIHCSEFIHDKRSNGSIVDKWKCLQG